MILRTFTFILYIDLHISYLYKNITHVKKDAKRLKEHQNSNPGQ